MINKIIIPVSLEGVGLILPTESVIFNNTKGGIAFGKPILCGELSPKEMASLPPTVERLNVPENIENPRRYCIDQLALRIAQNLSPELRGYYKD